MIVTAHVRNQIARFQQWLAPKAFRYDERTSVSSWAWWAEPMMIDFDIDEWLEAEETAEAAFFSRPTGCLLCGARHRGSCDPRNPDHVPLSDAEWDDREDRLGRAADLDRLEASDIRLRTRLAEMDAVNGWDELPF